MPPYEEYIEMIKPLWESHWLTNMGTYHQQFEQKLREYLCVPEISLTVNGHMALEMTIQAMKFPKDSEVITTPFTFISTTHAIVRNGLKPVFCDIKDTDYTIDETKIESLITEKTVAIIPVHVYGSICNVEKIEEIARKHSLKVIYDAAHAFGETYKGKSIASFGDASIFSFHATKVFHTIEGGAVCTDDHSLYQSIYNLKNFGIRSEESIVSVGANAKMNEMQAIMGICNLKYVSSEIEKRKLRVKRYRELLQNVEGIKLSELKDDVSYNGAYFPIVIANYKRTRDEIYKILKENNIFSRKYFYPITADAKCYHNEYQNVNLEKARYISKNVLVLPLYANLELSIVEKVCNLILE